MAYMWRSNPTKRLIIEKYLKTVLKNVPTEGTYSYGETVMVRDVDSAGFTVRKYDNRVGQPSTHPAAWFYMTAQILYSSNPQIYLGVNDNQNLQMVNNVAVYPNPANQLTVISYQLLESSTVKISVYDVLGKVVMDVINEKQIAGEHQLNINATELKNGIYFVKMNVNNEQKIQKLIIGK